MSNKVYHKTLFSFCSQRDKIWKEITTYLQRYIKKDSIILDIGAGYCSFINNITAKEKHAIDIYKGFRRYANEDVKTIAGNCIDLRYYKEEYFDVIFSSNLLEHLTLEEVKKTLREIIRVLKPGGRIILIQPNYRYTYKNYFDDYTHKTIFSDESLTDLLKSNKFKIIKRNRRFLPFSLKSKLPKSRILTRIYLNLPFKPLAKQMLIIGEKIR